MRLQLMIGITVSMLLAGSAPAAAQALDPAAEEISVKDALEEPADLDDEMDIRADDDPEDVGQLGLDPALDDGPDAEAPLSRDEGDD